MARGGKREGAGRKSTGGVSRTVALTLSAEKWSDIDASKQSVSAYIRHLFRTIEKQQKEINELKNK